MGMRLDNPASRRPDHRRRPYYDDGTDTTLAITGGTGGYTGAEGSMLLHATDNPVGSEYDFIFTLTK
jgi:hypothetical protein